MTNAIAKDRPEPLVTPSRDKFKPTLPYIGTPDHGVMCVIRGKTGIRGDTTDIYGGPLHPCVSF